MRACVGLARGLVQLAMAMWTTGVVPSQYRVVGPHAWPGAREAVLGATARVVFAVSGGKDLETIRKIKGCVRVHRRPGTAAPPPPRL